MPKQLVLNRPQDFLFPRLCSAVNIGMLLTLSAFPFPIARHIWYNRFVLVKLTSAVKIRWLNNKKASVIIELN